MHYIFIDKLCEVLSLMTMASVGKVKVKVNMDLYSALL